MPRKKDSSNHIENRLEAGTASMSFRRMKPSRSPSVAGISKRRVSSSCVILFSKSSTSLARANRAVAESATPWVGIHKIQLSSKRMPVTLRMVGVEFIKALYRFAVFQ